MKHTRFLIIGNSAGGISAAETIRRLDKTSQITIIGDEPYPAYSRPLIAEHIFENRPLEKMLFRSDGFYRYHDIETILGRRVTTIDVQNRTVGLDDGEKLQWEKLLLATGGTPLIPPLEGVGHEHVYTFTKLDDAKKIAARIQPEQRVVVIGGGLIGLSAADALTRCGVHVTIVEMKNYLLNTLLDETAAEIVMKALTAKGVHVITGDTVTKIVRNPGDHRIQTITLSSGQSIEAKTVILAAGIKPDIELAFTAGIKVNRGIVVDPHMQTSVADIYACGDAAEAYDAVYEEPRVTPIWPNAVVGGSVAGANMAGHKTVYRGNTAMNSMKYFGLSIVSAGMVIPPDDSYEIVMKHDDENYKKVILKSGLIKGLIFTGNIESSGIIHGLMRDRIDVGAFKEKLVADDFSFLMLPEEIWRSRLQSAFTATEYQEVGK